MISKGISFLIDEPVVHPRSVLPAIELKLIDKAENNLMQDPREIQNYMLDLDVLYVEARPDVKKV